MAAARCVPVAIFLLAMSSRAPGEDRAEPPADVVLRGGAVYTMDPARSWAESIAIKGGRIVAVGSDAAVAPRIGAGTAVIQLDGRMVLPGFHDAHVHPAAGIHDDDCQLAAAASTAAVREAIRAYVAANPRKSWIRGQGWLLPVFPNGNPHKSLLDELVPDRPAYFVASDGHSAWVNSRALELAKIDRNTPDPPNGHIERDAKTGEPTGTLREAAMGLVSPRLPKPTPEEGIEGLRRGLARASKLGITAIQDAAVDARTLEAYAALERQGKLDVRVTACLLAEPGQGVAQVESMAKLREQYRGNRLRADAVKIFADGVIDSKTAALLEPYEGSPDDRGTPNWSPEQLNEIVRALDREKFQVHVHAIGDRAIRMTLDAFEAARNANGVRDARHHIAHLQLIDPADIPRFRRLGVIANFEPYWAQADAYILGLTQPLLGPRRSRWLYPIASVAQTGAVLVFGSDWPVTTMNPLEILQVALTRRDPASGPGRGWIHRERIGLHQALAAVTSAGAYLNFRERETGSIELGKLADLVILDRNLFEIPREEIFRVRVWKTLLEGKVVHDAAQP